MWLGQNTESAGNDTAQTKYRYTFYLEKFAAIAT